MKTILNLSFSMTLVSLNALAASPCSGTPHLISSIETNQDATCVVAKLYEADSFCLVDANGNDLNGHAIDVSVESPESLE